MRTLSLLLLLALLTGACQNRDTNTEGNTAAGDPTMGADDAADTTATAYRLTPFTESASFPDAKLTAMAYKAGKFNYQISGYELGAQTPDAGQKMCANSAQGQHIHLIVDTLPYVAQYVAAFSHDVADGEHYLLSFLSRSYHESLKQADAKLAQKVTVKNKSITASEDISQPMLFYSRPKGAYTGAQETEKVMLDFYLVNAELGSQYKVKANINGEEHMIDTWQPYYIEGLPMGENTITLTLVDASGNPVQSPLNPVTRVFELKAE